MDHRYYFFATDCLGLITETIVLFWQSNVLIIVPLPLVYCADKRNLLVSDVRGIAVPDYGNAYNLGTLLYKVMMH